MLSRMIFREISLRKWYLSKDLKEAKQCELQEFRGKIIPQREKSKCKGPEARVHLAHSRNSKEAGVAGMESKGERNKR